MEKFYITTAIAYTSKVPHIGNVYEAILTDAIARFKRQQGYDVHFLTGTDEHGQKIQDLAKEAGIDPQEYVDKIYSEIRNIWDYMNVSYDQFIRTTDDYHKKTVADIFKKLYDQGDIYKSHYEGSYCKPCESFWTATQLEDGKCPDCGREVTKESEEAYFFKLSNYADRLVEYYDSHPDFIVPESRKNEMINNFIKPGLQDLCVSRTSFNWGIPVKFDDKHVTYVWLDALSNYITALGYNVEGENGEQFKKYWPADVHIIGKDIVRFHVIYWPIILMALGVELPKSIFGHPWLLTGKDKMSKSRGNVVYTKDLVDLFSVDAVRYYVLREMPYASDGSFTYENMISRYNTDLANILGNLVSRTVAMVNKYFDGDILLSDQVEPIDEELKNFTIECVDRFTNKMNEYKVSDALEALWDILRRANKYIDETTPWLLCKEESTKDRLKNVLYNLVEVIRIASVLLENIMPETAKEIQQQINSSNHDFNTLKEFNGTVVGTKVGEKKVLFNRLDEKKKLEEIEEVLSGPKEVFKEDIVYDDFEKLDLRVAEVLECKKHKNADKLLVFKLKVGNSERQIVSGIANFFKPEELVGKKVIIVANLKPRTLRGEKSEGMILSAELDGKLDLLTTSIESGGKVS